MKTGGHQAASFQNNWFDIRQIETGIFVIREPGHVQSFLITGERKAALIDTGMGFCPLRAHIEKITPLPVVVLNTHWHFDHIGGNAEFDTLGISGIESELVARSIDNRTLMAVYVQSCMDQGAPLPDDFVPERYEISGVSPQFTISHGDTFDLGGRTLTAIATPGHSQGSLSFLDSRTKILFCGDFLYNGTLYAHFTDGDLEAYIDSLERVYGQRSRISYFYGAHNEPRMNIEYCSRVLSVMKKIKVGSMNGIVMLEWGSPVVFFSGDGIEILVRQRGTKGVSLFEM